MVLRLAVSCDNGHMSNPAIVLSDFNVSIMHKIIHSNDIRLQPEASEHLTWHYILLLRFRV